MRPKESQPPCPRQHRLRRRLRRRHRRQSGEHRNSPMGGHRAKWRSAARAADRRAAQETRIDLEWLVLGRSKLLNATRAPGVMPSCALPRRAALQSPLLCSLWSFSTTTTNVVRKIGPTAANSFSASHALLRTVRLSPVRTMAPKVAPWAPFTHQKSERTAQMPTHPI